MTQRYDGAIITVRFDSITGSRGQFAMWVS